LFEVLSFTATGHIPLFGSQPQQTLVFLVEGFERLTTYSWVSEPCALMGTGCEIGGWL
jgi:hypothetical protein